MTTNDKLREELWKRLCNIATQEFSDAAAHVQEGGGYMPDVPEWAILVGQIEALTASKQKPTTCGYCTYEESDGSLIEQCQACKDKDHKQEPQPCAAPDWCRGRCECYSKQEPMRPAGEEDQAVYQSIAANYGKQEPQCRTDGRCQYAIDHGAEGLGHCPPGKCAMPEPQAQAEPEVVAKMVYSDWEHGSVIEWLVDDLDAGTELITLQSHREAIAQAKEARK